MKILITRELPCKLDEQFEVVDNTLWFVAHDEQGIVMGYGGIQFDWCGIVEVMIGPMFIFPAYRGNGLQIKLIEEREKWLKEKGFSTLTTCAIEGNIYSIRNILKAGFKETSRYGKEIWYEKKI